MLSQDRVKL